MRVVQISDTHLSVEHKHFASNADALHAWLLREQPDLVINTGDVSMNGAVTEADLQLGASWHASLGLDSLSVPGNHDVGDLASIRADQELNDARLVAFRTHIGDDRWVRDIPGWRLIGLNAMVFGTGHAEEEAQFTWVAEAAQTNDKIAIFLHKPLFIHSMEEGPQGYWTVLPEPRARLLEIFSGKDLRLVASGHLHVARQFHVDGVDYVWSPPASFVCGPMQPDLGGERHIGLVEHLFTSEGVTSTLVYPQDVTDALLDPVMIQIYPPVAE